MEAEVASELPWSIFLALWIPAGAVVFWFMTRLFRGFWPDEGPAAGRSEARREAPGAAAPEAEQGVAVESADPRG